jgi:MFS family permease
VRGLPRAFWFIWSGTLTDRLGNVAMLYLSISLVARYHFSASFAGLVLGLAGAGSAAGAIVGGVLTDRIGRKPTLLTANICTALLTAAMGLTTQAVPIALLVTAFGISGGVARPALSALLLDVVPDHQRARALNLNYWAMNIGFAGAATLSGLLANQPRLAVFVIDAVSTLSAGLLVFFRVRVPAAPKHPHAKQDGLATVLRDRTFMTFVTLQTGMWTVICCLGLMPITMLHHGLKPSLYGSIIAVNGVMIVLAQLFVPRLLRDRSRTRTLALCSLLVAVGFGAVGFAPSALALAGTVAIWTVGEMLSAPVSGTLTADLSPSRLRGRYQGVAAMSFTASGCFAPVLGGLVMDHVGDLAVWLGCFALGLLVAIGHLVTGPARERRAAAMKLAEVPTPESPITDKELALV